MCWLWLPASKVCHFRLPLTAARALSVGPRLTSKHGWIGRQSVRRSKAGAVRVPRITDSRQVDSSNVCYDCLQADGIDKQDLLHHGGHQPCDIHLAKVEKGPSGELPLHRSQAPQSVRKSEGVRANPRGQPARRRQSPRSGARWSLESRPSQSPSVLPSVTHLARQERKIVEAGRAIGLEQPEGNELLFLHCLFSQLGLPRSPVPNREKFERHLGEMSLQLRVGALWDGYGFLEQCIPYGTKPRLILLDLSTAAVRGNSRVVEVEENVADYLKRLGLINAGGPNGPLTGFRKQLGALAAVDVRFGVYGKPHTIRRNFIAGVTDWVTRSKGARTPWPRKIVLAADYYESLREHAVPLDQRAIAALSSSALALDIYCWLAHRLYRVGKPTRLPWFRLQEQFGQEYRELREFAREFRKQMRTVLAVYPQANVEAVCGGIKLRRSPPPVNAKRIVVPDISRASE